MAKKTRKIDYVYKQKSSLKHYSADAFVIRCLDSRFWKVAKSFIKSRGLKHIDPSSPAGGGGTISSLAGITV